MGEILVLLKKRQTAGRLRILYNGSRSALLGGPSPAIQTSCLAAGKWCYPAGLRRQVKDFPYFLNPCDGFFTGTKS